MSCSAREGLRSYKKRKKPHICFSFIINTHMIIIIVLGKRGIQILFFFLYENVCCRILIRSSSAKHFLKVPAPYIFVEKNKKKYILIEKKAFPTAMIISFHLTDHNNAKSLEIILLLTRSLCFGLTLLSECAALTNCLCVDLYTTPLIIIRFPPDCLPSFSCL